MLTIGQNFLLLMESHTFKPIISAENTPQKNYFRLSTGIKQTCFPPESSFIRSYSRASLPTNVRHEYCQLHQYLSKSRHGQGVVRNSTGLDSGTEQVVSLSRKIKRKNTCIGFIINQYVYLIWDTQIKYPLYNKDTKQEEAD